MVVSVYSTYIVPQDTLPGPLTAYAQQYNMLTNTRISDPQPRRQLITDLIKYIKKKINIGTHQIILGIDANGILEADGTPIKKTQHYTPETRV